MLYGCLPVREISKSIEYLLSPSRKGLNAREAAFAVKKYKSHRAVGTVKEIKEFIAAQEASRASHKAIFRL